MVAVQNAGCVVVPFLPSSYRRAGLLRLPGGSLLHPGQSLRALHGELSALDTDICHVQFAQGLQAWTAAIAAPVPLVVSVWGGDVLYEQQAEVRPSVRALTAALINLADLVTVESPYMDSAISSLGLSPRRTLATCWGIDLERFRPHDRRAARAALGLPPDVPIIYSPRIAQPFYNIDVIVRALPLIREKCPSTCLLLGTFLADPDYLKELLALANELGVRSAVHVLDSLAEEKLPLCYAAAELTVSLPPSDGVPRSLFEAMACGSVNVLGDLASYRSYITHDDTAILMPIDPVAVAQSCAALLTNPQRCSAIRDRAISRVAEIGDARREAQRVVEAYGEILPAGRARVSIRDRLTVWGHLIAYLYGH